MSGVITFEAPAVWVCGLPFALLLGVAAWRQASRGMAPGRIAVLLCFRGVSLAVLLFLAARPVRINREPVGPDARPVVVLLDRSESMSLKESDASRYDRALDFFRRRLAPALRSANLPVQGILFDQSAETAGPAQFAETRPQGKRTNLGGAIAQALNGGSKPLAVIALTDGASNESVDDSRATGMLAESGVPFIGVGFGSDSGIQTISLRRIEAPADVAPNSVFNVSAVLEMINAEDAGGFELVLFRDGQMLQKKSLAFAAGSHTRVESFQVTEPARGTHNYSVQLLTPNLANLKCIDAQASTSVRISDEGELRVLYLQGALTWDYKFIALALHDEPAIKLTGLTRTSKESVFRQNVESTTELINGFPSSLDELAPYQVIVLSNLRPADLSPEQQELLGRFCGELGRGILIVGGPAIFDQSWRGTRLERLLPVIFAESQGSVPDREFHLQLAPETLQHPLFRLSEDRAVSNVWAAVPTFSQFSRVEDAKKGAHVWISHPTESGPHGHRILMASQQYGAGQSAVLCVQNFWRWRLAKDSDPRQFDRFWRQLFRWLGGAGRSQVSIELASQELRPQRDVQVFLERRAEPQLNLQTNQDFLVRVEGPGKKVVQEEAVELASGQQLVFRFHPEKPGLFTLTVSDHAKTEVASRPIEIRDTDVELEQTARNMETLTQWAAVSDGLSFKVEECPQASDLVAQIKTKVEQVRLSQQTRRAFGLNAWLLGIVLSGLTGEWLLRKRWALI